MSETQKTKFELWIEKQSEDVQNMYREDIQGLKNTIEATREERDGLSKQLKKLAKEADASSELGKQLGELTDKLTKSEKKSKFFEQAILKGAKRPNVAYAIANSENLFDNEGEPDWEKIQETVPELFVTSNTNNNAGSGTTNKPEVNPNKAFKEKLEQGVTVRL